MHARGGAQLREQRSLLITAAVTVACLVCSGCPHSNGPGGASFVSPSPLATRLQRWKLGRVTSVLVVVTATFLVIGALGWVVARQAVHLATELPRYQDEIVSKVERLRNAGTKLGANFTRLGKELDRVTEEPSSQPPVAPSPITPTTPEAAEAAEQLSGIETLSSTEVRGLPATAPFQAGVTPGNPLYTVAVPEPASPIEMLGPYVGLILGPLGTAALVLIFVIFMLLDRENLRDRVIWLVSGGQYIVSTRALDDAATRISRYMIAQTIVNGSYGLVVAVGLWLIGLTAGQGTSFPSFVLWGLLCAVLRFIPYVGPWLAITFPVSLSLAVYPGFTVFGLTVGLLILLELISNNVMEPWLYGTTTGISTVPLLVSAVFWTWLWGPVGLLLATPLTVCLAVVGRHVPQLKFIDVLLGDRPPLPPATSYYQRLLADDKEEAREILLKRSEDRPERIADDVLIPALLMTRRDRAADRLPAQSESAVLAAITDHVVSPDISFRDKNVGGQEVASCGIVTGCAAHHASEELVVEMLARMLEGPGDVRVEATCTRLLPSEVESVIDRTNATVVFIAVLPPGGLDQTRHLCRRFRKRFPDLWIVIGYWGRTRDFDTLLVRLRKAGASYVTTSMQQTVDQIRALLPTYAASSPAAASGASTEAAVQ